MALNKCIIITVIVISLSNVYVVHSYTTFNITGIPILHKLVNCMMQVNVKPIPKVPVKIIAQDVMASELRFC